VWIYNAATKTRVKRLRLIRAGSSIALTHDAVPLLLVQAESGSTCTMRTKGLS